MTKAAEIFGVFMAQYAKKDVILQLESLNCIAATFL